MTKAGTPTVMSDGKLLFVAADDRGRELEVVVVPLVDGDLLVIHVMPTARGGTVHDQQTRTEGS